MSVTAVEFHAVTKTFPSYQHVSGGIKSFLFNLRQCFQGLRRRTLALDDVTFSINKGECFGVIGRNGAGKSTTLGLIAGVLRQDSGVVEVNGRVSPLLELGSGFHPELTGRENIVLNGILMGCEKSQILAKIQKIIDFSELGPFIDQPLRTYSSGMYAKLGFSVVANLNPEILLVDEILAVGDAFFSRKCLDVIESFRRDPQVTIVLVSHDLDNVRKVCDRVAWIENHTIKMVGLPNHVIDSYLNEKG